MDLMQRLRAYTMQNSGDRLTPRQRRRAVKKAGRDPRAVVERGGMGYPPSMRGYREIVGLDHDDVRRP